MHCFDRIKEASKFFLNDAVVHMMVTDKLRDVFTQEYRQEHHVEANPKLWDELTFRGLEQIQKVINQYTANLQPHEEIVRRRSTIDTAICRSFCRCTRWCEPSPL